MKRTAFALAILALAVPAMATQTLSYGWEDGVGTILGFDGNLVDPLNVSGIQNGLTGDCTPPTWSTDGPHSGDRYLHVAEEPHSGTPEAYVAWITGLQEGDIIDASFWAWDNVDDFSYSYGAPGVRIWGHYTSSDDINNDLGSAGGNSTYTTGIGWQELSHSWTFDSSGGTRDALVVEVRLYSYLATSAEARTDYWVDDVTVTAPDHATIHFAPEPGSLLLIGLAGLFLRRR